MIKLERFEVMNMNNAIRGARNPLNSWARMDSYFDEEGKFVFGPNDLPRDYVRQAQTTESS